MVKSQELVPFPALDVQTVDRWKKVTLNGGTNTFKWKLTAPHSTKEWKYYITKKDWNPNKPLTRSDLDLVPFYVKMMEELDLELP